MVTGIFLVLGAVVVVGGLVVFFRSVFGGSTFKAERKRDKELTGGPPGPRADANPGAGRWQGGGGLGTFGQWNDHGSGH
jgi:hypothetical protein